MKGRQLHKEGIALAILFLVLVLSLVAPVMRESDQASLLSGSIELARTGQIWDQEFYNYSRQYGSYWILALVFRVVGLAEVGAAPDAVVLAGNLVAALIFTLGMGGLLVKRGPRCWGEAILFASVLFAPVVFFSAPLLSSNIISAGFLCLLVLLLSGSAGGGRDWLCGIVGFLAVASRGDAVLVLPFLSLLSLSVFSWSRLFRQRRLWFLGIASILALLLGSVICPTSVTNYAAFFQPSVAAAFVTFGLGAAGIIGVFLTGILCWQSRKARDWQRVLVLLTGLFPLLFYGRVLYSPRHLLTTALVILFFLCFESGKRWWSEFSVKKVARPMIMILGLFTFLPYLFGVRLSSMKSGSPVVTSPTLFPSADGYWPMGCYAQFASWLRVADEKPIDHNQRVWAAWSDVTYLPPEEEGYHIRSHGLVSLGEFRLRLLAQEDMIMRDSSHILFDSRSLVKKSISVKGQFGEQVALPPANERQLLAESMGERIFRSGSRSPESIPLVETLTARLRERVPSGDYLVAQVGADWNFYRGGGLFQWFFVQVPPWQEDGGAENWHFRKLVAGRDGFLEAQESEEWIVRSALPLFFNVNDYGN